MRLLPHLTVDSSSTCTTGHGRISGQARSFTSIAQPPFDSYTNTQRRLKQLLHQGLIDQRDASSRGRGV